MQTDTVFTCYQGITSEVTFEGTKVPRYYLGIRYVVTEEINLARRRYVFPIPSYINVPSRRKISTPGFALVTMHDPF